MAFEQTTNGSNGTLASDRHIPAWKIKARAHRQSKVDLIPGEWRLPEGDIPSAAREPNAIPLVEKHLNAFELEATNATAPQIVAKIHDRTWSSYDVTRAFCHRAALLQQLTACLTEVLFEQALIRARELDEHLATTGRTVGPLHGLPISVKDNHDIEGVDSSLGWVGLLNKPAPADAPAITLYRNLGAVLYVKTNIPQSLMMSDSYNHVFGQSVNSMNRKFISGGSSGGEAALVGGGGSVIGLGTDIGGSVRIPATVQGLYGLCPTIGRVANRESERKGVKYVVPPVAGPLTRDIESMELLMKSYTIGRAWEDDPGLLPLPWKEEEASGVLPYDRKLKVAYVVDDGVVRCQPAVERAVKDTVQKLANAGHKVCEWAYARKTHKAGYDLWLKAVLADGGKKCAALCELSEEPLVEGMLVGRPENELDVEGRAELSDQIWDFQKAYMQEWKRQEVDVLIMPVTQWVALRPKEWVKSDMYVGYTSICNLLNWTSLAVPATTVDAKLDAPSDEWKAYKGRSFHDQYNHDGYDLESFVGMPVGVQLITGRFGEERAISVARMLRSYTPRTS